VLSSDHGSVTSILFLEEEWIDTVCIELIIYFGVLADMVASSAGDLNNSVVIEMCPGMYGRLYDSC
jgi:hypothetical protein